MKKGCETEPSDHLRKSREYLRQQRIDFAERHGVPLSWVVLDLNAHNMDEFVIKEPKVKHAIVAKS